MELKTALSFWDTGNIKKRKSRDHGVKGTVFKSFLKSLFFMVERPEFQSWLSLNSCGFFTKLFNLPHSHPHPRGCSFLVPKVVLVSYMNSKASFRVNENISEVS